jgi:heme-degrading monooxygenase HmoA
MTITLINTFTVPAPEADAFFHHWQHTADVMAAQPGLIRARMYRSLDGDPRFVNVAHWSSRESLTAATTTPEFRATTDALRTDPALHVIAHPVVYRVAYEIHPSSG